VTTLLDLTQPYGKHLDRHKLCGTFSLLSSKTHGLSVLQDRPSEAEWALRKMNSHWSTESVVLYQPLGDWVLDIHDQSQKHFVYWSDSAIWISIDGSYVKCKETNLVKLYNETSMSCSWDELPKEAIPIHTSGMRAPGQWKVVYEGSTINDVPNIASTTCNCYINTLPE
jgi:hypothetical protein